MLTLPQSVVSRAFVRGHETNTHRPLDASAAVRLVQVVLAIYLLPVLALALAVGSVGLLVIAVVHLFTGPAHRPDRF
jgi:Na+/H+ antiporter NhaB